MDINMLLPIVTKALGWALTLFGGAKALETTLENFVMPKVPQAWRWLVTPLLSYATAFVVSLLGGADLNTALQAATATWGAAAFIHDHPALTSADWALPAPPATADGVPGGPK